MNPMHKNEKIVLNLHHRNESSQCMQAAALEAALFSKDDGTLENTLGKEFTSQTAPFEVDRNPSFHELDEDHPQRITTQNYKKPLWTDPQDDSIQITVTKKSMLRKLRQTEDEIQLTGKQYEERLRQQHQKLNPKAAAWASLEPKTRISQSKALNNIDENTENTLDSLLQGAGGLLSSSVRSLPRTRLETTRLHDANHAEPSQSVVKSVEFHHNGQLLMVAGLDRHVRFFNIDGVQNPKVQSIYLEDMPVHKAGFTSQGTRIVAAGRRSFFYLLDLEGGAIERIAGIFGEQEKSFESFASHPSSSILAFFGRDGNIPLVSTSSRQSIGKLKMNGSVRAGAFSSDGFELMTSGGDGTIYLWDLKMQRCRGTCIDEGSIGGASLATSSNGSLFASGSTSGIVNVYKHPSRHQRPSSMYSNTDSDAPSSARALKPLKALPHLTTTADSMAFNSDGQILAIASRMKKDALRLVHVPSLTVFSNWPTSRSPLHYVHSLCFSPQSGYLCVGNAKGRVVLYRLHHYPQA